MPSGIITWWITSMKMIWSASSRRNTRMPILRLKSWKMTLNTGMQWRCGLRQISFPMWCLISRLPCPDLRTISWICLIWKQPRIMNWLPAMLWKEKFWAFRWPQVMSMFITGRICLLRPVWKFPRPGHSFRRQRRSFRSILGRKTRTLWRLPWAQRMNGRTIPIWSLCLR